MRFNMQQRVAPYYSLFIAVALSVYVLVYLHGYVLRAPLMRYGISTSGNVAALKFTFKQGLHRRHDPQILVHYVDTLGHEHETWHDISSEDANRLLHKPGHTDVPGITLQAANDNNGLIIEGGNPYKLRWYFASPISTQVYYCRAYPNISTVEKFPDRSLNSLLLCIATLCFYMNTVYVYFTNLKITETE